MFKSVAIMQPYFFPYIGYFHLIQSVDLFISFDDVNFIKKGWINKNQILAKDIAHPIALPIKQLSQNKKINESFIFEPAESKSSILRMINDSYRKKAPFFEENIQLIQDLLLLEDDNIAVYNSKILRGLAEYLNIETQFKYSSEIPHNKELKGPEKIIELVKSVGSTSYVNAVGGKDLYDKTEFNKQGIELKFIQSSPVVYDQKQSSFVPYLSIIDVLMFTGRAKTIELIQQFSLT